VHADPAGDLPAPVLALDCEMVIAGPQGRRTVAAADFFEDLFTTAVGEGEVRLEVDRWYRGGDAATVVLTAPGGDAPALVGATDFQQGEQYLVSADQGTVSVCGLTGPASPELQAVYDQAFPG